MKNQFTRNILLAAVTGTALLICLLVRAFAPAVNLPRLDIPNLTALCLLALLLESSVVTDDRRFCWVQTVLAAVTFGLLPLAAGFAGPLDGLKLALVGAAVFTVTAVLFDSMEKRMASGGISKISLWIGAVGLFLAVQCFAGWI